VAAGLVAVGGVAAEAVEAGEPNAGSRRRWALEQQTRRWREGLAEDLASLPALAPDRHADRHTDRHARHARHALHAHARRGTAADGLRGGGRESMRGAREGVSAAPSPSPRERAPTAPTAGMMMMSTAQAAAAGRARGGLTGFGAAPDAADRALLFGHGRSALRPLPLPTPPCTPEDPLARQSGLARASAAYEREASPPHRRPPASPLFRAAPGPLGGAHGMGFFAQGKLQPPPPPPSSGLSLLGRPVRKHGGGAEPEASISGADCVEMLMAPARAHGLMWRPPARMV
jgi:hypothetical protein